jgi:hypothetical protein
MREGTPDYRAYMLRLWRVQEGPRYTWRASLEEVLTHNVQGFANLEALIRYLQEVIATNPQSSTSVGRIPLSSPRR